MQCSPVSDSASSLPPVAATAGGNLVPIQKKCEQCGGEILVRKKDIKRSFKIRRFCSLGCGRKHYLAHSDVMAVTEKMRAAAQTVDAKLKRQRAAATKEATQRATKARMMLPQFQALPSHHSARVFRLRDPRGRTYVFKNLAWFIRENSHLFEAGDVSFDDTVRCRAYGGLKSICPRYKYVVGSWKGWTWFSQIERFNGGHDLLDRRELNSHE